MPGVATHLITLEESILELKSRIDSSLTSQEDKAEYERIVKTLEENLPYAQFGAVGPDLTFFLGASQEKMSYLDNVFGFINDVGGAFDRSLAIGDQLGMSNTVDTIEQLTDTIGDLVVLFENVIVAKMVEVAQYFMGNLFGKPGARQEGEDLGKWAWGEVLHQARTGSVASKLIRAADDADNDQLRAYAYGYISHLAADIAGHPYVNQVTGGLPRAYSARHHLCENYIDAKVWWDIKNEEAACAGFQNKISISDEHIDEFAEIFSEILKEERFRSIQLSDQQRHILPEAPTKKELVDAYHTLKRLLGLISGTIHLSPPEPPGVQMPPLPSSYPGRSYSVNSNTPNAGCTSVWDALLGIVAAVLESFKFMIEITRFVIDILTGVINYPVEWAMYLLQMELYSNYMRMHQFLVLSGVMYPFHYDVDDWVGSQFITSGAPDPFFPYQPQMNWFARLEGLTGFDLELSDSGYLNYPESALDDPSDVSELPGTLSSPYVNESPLYFIREANISSHYRNESLNASSPVQHNELNDTLLRRQMFSNPEHADGATEDKAFGSAATIAVDLLVGVLPLINYDIDSDRGYSSRCWYELSNNLPRCVRVPEWI